MQVLTVTNRIPAGKEPTTCYYHWLWYNKNINSLKDRMSKFDKFNDIQRAQRTEQCENDEGSRSQDASQKNVFAHP